MARRRSLLLAVLALLGACGQCGPQRPAAPAPIELDPDLRAALPVNDAGLPLLIVADAPLATGFKVGLAYDEQRDDPLTRWAECLGRIGACYQTNRGRLGGCVDFIDRCATNAGGRGCCPGACIDAFNAAVRAGVPDKEAVDQTFIAGACVDGYLDFLDGGVAP